MAQPVDENVVRATLRDGIILDTAQPACHSVGALSTAVMIVLVRSAAHVVDCSAEPGTASDLVFDGTPESISSAATNGSETGNNIADSDTNRSYDGSSTQPSAVSDGPVQIDSTPPAMHRISSRRLHELLPVLTPLADAVFAWGGGPEDRSQRVLRLMAFICVLPACPYYIDPSTTVRELSSAPELQLHGSSSERQCDWQYSYLIK